MAARGPYGPLASTLAQIARAAPLAVRMRQAGATQPAIAAELNRLEIQPPGLQPWSRKSVAKLLAAVMAQGPTLPEARERLRDVLAELIRAAAGPRRTTRVARHLVARRREAVVALLALHPVLEREVPTLLGQLTVRTPKGEPWTLGELMDRPASSYPDGGGAHGRAA